MSRDLLDIPHLARDVLRQYAIERVAAKLPVAWVSDDGMQRTARPDDGKFTGAWRVVADRWEGHHREEWLIAELAKARAIEVLDD